jgi:hypothetical protein
MVHQKLIDNRKFMPVTGPQPEGCEKNLMNLMGWFIPFVTR